MKKCEHCGEESKKLKNGKCKKCFFSPPHKDRGIKCMITGCNDYWTGGTGTHQMCRKHFEDWCEGYRHLYARKKETEHGS